LEKPESRFRILSIDGGGIRGLFPALYLAQLENELITRGYEKTQIYQHFDLICGTSTGGILALALSLGIPAVELHDLYLENAKTIFGNKRSFFGSLKKASHQRAPLEKLIREKFKEVNGGKDPRIDDCKTNICIPIYDLIEGKPRVLKNRYHERFIHDFHIPAYQAALATSAAPTYFEPYNAKYEDMNGLKKAFTHKVDGGVVANNPSLIGVIEAQKAFNKSLDQISLLSIGTGEKPYQEGGDIKNWGILYWMQKGGRKRLIELFMQAQSQQVENILCLMHQGIDGSEDHNFVYDRINTELNEDTNVEMDECDPQRLDRFSERAVSAFQHTGNKIINNHFL
jgi:patatin-like phospholipase/acyl hydrolase